MVEFVIFTFCLVGCSWVSYTVGWNASTAATVAALSRELKRFEDEEKPQ